MPPKSLNVFVEFYYKTFDSDRSQLGALYKDTSMLTFESSSTLGTLAIVEKLTGLPFQKVQHRVDTFDAQPSNTDGGILVLVTGALMVDDQPQPMNYTQVFNLLPSASSYFVQNDVFKLIYAASLGVLCIILGFALGIANIFHFNALIAFSIILLCSAFLLVFIEVPLLLRICPTSARFDAFVRRFTTNYMRAVIYGAMSVAQWLSLIVGPSSLIAAAVVLLLAGLCYALAGLKNQDFVGSKTLGGQGVAQMIV
ncbi:hypothetical protein DV735_g1497, partial [Chaetothyriales sp. CBS 134920]